MKDLVFSISFRNHTFNIRTTPRSTLCYYQNEGKYTTSLTFASNTYATVEYKNIRFSGTVTKKNKWSVQLNYQPILKKRYNSYYYISEESVQRIEGNEVSSDVPTEQPEKILWLYNQLIEFLSELYLCIEDKETFKDQLCEYLAENYPDDEIEDLDSIVEYENWNDVEDDEDPIIEKISLKNKLIDECQDFFICFRQAETDNKNKKAIITLENILKETPGLSLIPHELLEKEFSRILDENYAELLKPDIWYSLEDILMELGEKIFNSCQYKLFVSTIEEKIDRILSAMGIGDIEKDELYLHFKSKYSEDELPSDEEFEWDVKSYVDEYMAFNQIYGKYFALFNTDHIKIEWNDEILCLFQKYDDEGIVTDPQNLSEYEVYKYVMPFYRKHFLRKNSNRYKPVIEQLPEFTMYGSTVLDILFKHNVIACNGDTVDYNKDGNIALACEEIMAISEN